MYINKKQQLAVHKKIHKIENPNLISGSAQAERVEDQ